MVREIVSESENLNRKIDHVPPVLTQNVCDSTREEEIVVLCCIAISAIFVKNVTRLIVAIGVAAETSR